MKFQNKALLQFVEIDPSLAAKLAKMIDSKNPEQTVELLTKLMSKVFNFPVILKISKFYKFTFF
jgi:hypothetical protein